MSAAEYADAQTAMRVAEALRAKKVDGPWDVFGERIRRYEIHLNGREIEMVRGPIHFEGYGLRLFRSAGEATGVGFASTSDLSAPGIDESLSTAESTAKLSRFPARSIALPGSAGGGLKAVETVDSNLWGQPEETLRGFVHRLFGAFEGRRNEVPSFGSVRASLVEATLANSEGVERRFKGTLVDFELAVKGSGGPEGPAPGEYWVNARTRRVESAVIPARVEEWCQKSQDVRRAVPPPSGALSVLFPVRVLADVLPSILGYRLAGGAQLRRMSPPVGTRVGPESLTIHDDGLLPFAPSTAPVDDEGTPAQRTALVEKGEVRQILQDVAHASALGAVPTANGRRDSVDFVPWFHFTRPPGPGPTTIVVAPGDGGNDAEMVEGVEDGIWLDQLGYAFPDPISAAFGGEIRMAYRIRHGKLAEPVRGGTVGGVVLADPGAPSLLSGVGAIGSHSQLAGSLSSPTLRIDRFSVAGGS